MKSVAVKLPGRKNCSVLTYSDFPVQLWNRIDDTIYIGSTSVLRRSRQNCVFAVPVGVPGIKVTFLDHFDELQKRGFTVLVQQAKSPIALRSSRQMFRNY